MTCNTKTESQFRNTLVALLAGVGAGIVVGLAIAPKSGKKLRADIGNTADDYLESASQKAEDLRRSAANLAQRGLKEVQNTKGNAGEKVKDTVHGAMDVVNSAVNAGAKRGYEVIDSAADAVRSGMRG